MIVKSNWPRRVSVLNLMLVVLLAFVVLPQWMMAEGPDDPVPVAPPTASISPVKPNESTPTLADDELEPVASVPVVASEPEIESPAVEPVDDDLPQVGRKKPRRVTSPEATPLNSPFDSPAAVSNAPGYGQPGAGYSQSGGGYGQPITSPYQANPYPPKNLSQATNVYPATGYASAVPSPESLKTMLRVFQLKHRKPAEMLPLIKPFVDNLPQAKYSSPQKTSRPAYYRTAAPPVAVNAKAAQDDSEMLSYPTGNTSSEAETSDTHPVLQIDKLRVLADADSKSLIARGPAVLVELVESVVKAMDVPEGAPIGKIEHPHMRAFNLRTRDAMQILMIADKLELHPGIIYPSPQIGLNPLNANQSTSHRTIPRLPSGVKTLIVAGNKEELEDIARLIEALDPPADAEREAEIDDFLDDLAAPDRPANSEPTPRY